jgi:hypothetical protein
LVTTARKSNNNNRLRFPIIVASIDIIEKPGADVLGIPLKVSKGVEFAPAPTGAPHAFRPENEQTAGGIAFVGGFA